VMPSGRVDEPPRFGDVSLKGVATPTRARSPGSHVDTQVLDHNTVC
jgi:hypothetical protein